MQLECRGLNAVSLDACWVALNGLTMVGDASSAGQGFGIIVPSKSYLYLSFLVTRRVQIECLWDGKMTPIERTPLAHGFPTGADGQVTANSKAVYTRSRASNRSLV